MSVIDTGADTGADNGTPSDTQGTRPMACIQCICREEKGIVWLLMIDSVVSYPCDRLERDRLR